VHTQIPAKPVISVAAASLRWLTYDPELVRGITSGRRLHNVDPDELCADRNCCHKQIEVVGNETPDGEEREKCRNIRRDANGDEPGEKVQEEPPPPEQVQTLEEEGVWKPL